MDEGNGEDRTQKKTLSRYNSDVLVMLGRSGVRCHEGDNVVYSGLRFSCFSSLG